MIRKIKQMRCEFFFSFQFQQFKWNWQLKWTTEGKGPQNDVFVFFIIFEWNEKNKIKFQGLKMLLCSFHWEFIVRAILNVIEIVRVHRPVVATPSEENTFGDQIIFVLFFFESDATTLDDFPQYNNSIDKSSNLSDVDSVGILTLIIEMGKCDHFNLIENPQFPVLYSFVFGSCSRCCPILFFLHSFFLDLSINNHWNGNLTGGKKMKAIYCYRLFPSSSILSYRYLNMKWSAAVLDKPIIIDGNITI